MKVRTARGGMLVMLCLLSLGVAGPSAWPQGQAWH